MHDYVDNINKSLSKNEIAVIALNEIAIECEHDFFFHSLNKDC